MGKRSWQVAGKFWRILAVVVTTIMCVGAVGVPAAQANGDCVDGVQASGAKYRICMPPAGEWNGDLVVYAHGYVAFNEPIEIPQDQLSIPDGPSIPDMITGMGYAFATTSYSVNGLAVKEGIADLLDVVTIFTGMHGDPRYVYLAGASEGGLITALSLEQHPEVYDGGLSACGPVGDFRRQIDYWGDTRVLFDYFFPGVIPGSAVEIPDDVIANWDAVYEGQVRAALQADPSATATLLKVARAPTGSGDPSRAIEDMVQLMWYSVFATNDGAAKLGGQPFSNVKRIYYGSGNDWQLNKSVARFAAEGNALAEINARYQTSGNLSNPVVTLHTTGDPIVPYWHEPLYRAKVWRSGSMMKHINVPSLRHGHCDFSAAQVLASFTLLVVQVEGVPIPNAEQVLWSPQSRLEYQQLGREWGFIR